MGDVWHVGWMSDSLSSLREAVSERKPVPGVPVPLVELPEEGERRKAAKMLRRENKVRALAKKEARLSERITSKKAFLDAMKVNPTPAAMRKFLFTECERFDFNPVEVMIKFAQSPSTCPRDAFVAAKSLSELMFPKPKSIDIGASGGGDVVVEEVKFVLPSSLATGEGKGDDLSGFVKASAEPRAGGFSEAVDE